MRQRFLEQFGKACPGFLNRLRRLLPVYVAARPFLRFRDSDERWIACQLGWFTGAFGTAAKALELRAELSKLAAEYFLSCGWVLDSALTSLDFWYRSQVLRDDRRIVVPATDVRNRAEQEVRVSGQFSDEVILADPAQIEDEVDRVLRRYVKEIKSEYTPIPDSYARDVTLTAKRFAGKLPHELAIEEGKDVRTVTRATSRMARLLGLPDAFKRGRPKRN